MASTLTIVASPPGGGDGKDDPAIKDILDLLEPATAVPANDHLLARASSIEDVVHILTTAAVVGAPPRLIQLVGHGSPGILWLGRPWDMRYAAGPQGPVFMLDSSPYFYGILRGKVPAATQEVRVLGCAVGDAKAATATDGPTLLFDLAHMWGCDVSAPTAIIGRANFDAAGVFATTGLLVTARGQCVGSAQAAPEPVGNGSFANIEFLKVIAAPILGPRERHHWPLALDVGVGLHGLHVDHAEETDLGPILAAVETSYLVRIGGSAAPARADVLANGRLLRVFAGLAGPSRTFKIPAPARARFRAAHGELLTQLAGL